MKTQDVEKKARLMQERKEFLHQKELKLKENPPLQRLKRKHSLKKEQVVVVPNEPSSRNSLHTSDPSTNDLVHQNRVWWRETAELSIFITSL